MESKRESILKQKEEAELKVQQYEHRIQLLQNRQKHLEKKADRQRTKAVSFARRSAMQKSGVNVSVSLCRS